MYELILFGILYFAWILYRNDELEKNERKMKLELEKLISIAEERCEEIEKKDDLIFGLFEQVDQLKDNVEILQHELTKYASRTKNQYLELKDLKKNVDIQLSRESGFDETF